MTFNVDIELIMSELFGEFDEISDELSLSHFTPSGRGTECLLLG